MIKDIVVHLDGSAEDETRIQYADFVAGQFNAAVTGLHVHFLPEVMAITDPAGSQYLQSLLEEDTASARKIDAGLADKFKRFAGPSELRRVDAFEASARESVATEARVADLFLALRPYGEGGGGAAVAEAALFGSGRSCLFVPPGGKPPAAFERVVIAWKNTAEAARAVAEALPFLSKAKVVEIVMVEEGGKSSEQRGEEPGADIARHLDRHGIAVEIRPISGWADVADALVNEVTRSGADLLVMGGYGHSRVWEWVLGGTTRKVLSTASVPVLVAH